MATIKDVAKRAGVSFATVSYVLNGNRPISSEVSGRVLEAVRELNYRPHRTAQNLVRKKNDCIGLFGPDPDVGRNQSFFTELLAGIMQVASRRGYNLIVYPETRSADGELDIRLDGSKPIDGAIIINPRTSDEYLKGIVEDKAPFVLVGRPHDCTGIHFTDNDNVACAYNATKHLVSLNHARMLFINGPADFSLSEDRLRGYRIALEEAGIALEDSLVAHTEFSIEAGRRAVQDALGKDMPFTAVVANSDLFAVGAINALLEADLRIPADVSVICIGETFMSANYNPRITGIDLKITDIAATAATQLIDVIEKRLMAVTHNIIPFVMNVRDTTAHVKKSVKERHGC